MRFFKQEEFKCKCGRASCDAPTAISPNLAQRLDALRERVGRPVIVTSGVRCPAHNAAVGGKPNSEHLTGEGCDLAAIGPREKFDMVEAALAVGFTRLGWGKGFIHVGTSSALPERVMWDY
jgi:zinc D-Ala-D-Ala carboxypeptidase